MATFAQKKQRVPEPRADAETWRYTCPEGHTNIQRNAGDGYRCQSCGETYDGDPVDQKLEGNR